MNYKIMDNDDFVFLKSIVKEENIILRDDIEEDFSHDELQTVYAYPEVHIYPTDKKQIQEIIKYANKYKIPVTTRGSGTGLVGACVPIKGGILLDLSKMNQFIELDKINMTLRLEPGVLVMDIYEYVEKEGLFYAPDPGEKSATIGGNIATNAGGMRAVKYGVTRDWIRGLEVVLANGELVNFGGKVVKNSSGYDLKDLIIGSEGSLGIVVEATLKLIPLPRMTVSLLIPFENKEKAIAAVPEVITHHTLPTAVEFLENDALKFSESYLGKKIPNADYPAYLLISYDGSTQDEIDYNVDIISKLCVDDLGAIDVYLVDTEERKQSVWSARGAFLEAIKASTTMIDECDVVLPRSQITQYLDFTRNLSEELDIRIPYFGHAGDGNLHIYFCKDNLSDIEWEEKLKIGFDKLYTKAFEFSGMVSGEHGIGYAKKEYLRKQLGENQIQLMKGIKAVFDPNNILNPEKVI
ncbi:MAG: FAD-linked oxidase C-terminal domain-containing protein [Candidatus Izemoplasmatales bacterium]|nr:FAD-linked oxidase C-terminal domain-containing protein [Candidatus Izemoplasmatales bacterium]